MAYAYKTRHKLTIATKPALKTNNAYNHPTETTPALAQEHVTEHKHANNVKRNVYKQATLTVNNTVAATSNDYNKETVKHLKLVFDYPHVYFFFVKANLMVY
jgi:hypothetical protein